MTAQRPTFRQIPGPLDVGDELLDRLNEKLGVPTLVPSAPASQRPSSGHQEPQDSPKPDSRPSPSRRRTNAQAVEKPAPASSASVEKLSIELPGYLADALRIQAAQKRTTVRYIVMETLAASGFAVEPADRVPHGRRRPIRPRKR